MYTNMYTNIYNSTPYTFCKNMGFDLYLLYNSCQLIILLMYYLSHLVVPCL